MNIENERYKERELTEKERYWENELRKWKKELLQRRILKEMVIDTPLEKKAWKLAKEIYNENLSRLKKGVTLQKIYKKALKELKKGGKNGSMD